MKNIIIIGLSSLLLFCVFSASAQRNCATMDRLELQEKSPEHAAALIAIEKQTEQYVRDLAEGRAVSTVITIPVVFHVVHRTATENISDAQIQSQLQVLNDDFRRLNADADNTWSQAADTEIQFCLATIDPNGNSTTGITRTETTVSSFGTDDDVKFDAEDGKDAWPAADYLNFWVCNIGGGVLGYAQFPGGDADTDGVVCDYRYVGTTGTATAPFHLGRTATHEVGHWLNLSHIWGDGGCSVDDDVSDTPESNAPNYGCATGHVSCSTTDMVQNYMDYSDDACFNLFTEGQKNRMQATLNGARASLLNSPGCGSLCPDNLTITDTYNIGSDEYFEVGDWINSTATINNGADITHDAGSYICMNPGFIADNGSVFLAKIDGCDDNPNELVQEDTSLTDEESQIQPAVSAHRNAEQITVKNFPNPFTGQTTIAFDLPEDVAVTLFVSDMNGKQIARLLDNKPTLRGTHQVVFDGKAYPAGMYYYTIQAGKEIATQKMILTK